VVADDLTGALDATVAFAARGMATAVARRPEDVPAAIARAPEVLGISTGSRETGREPAVQAVGAALDALGGVRPAIVFKKVDSRLKGHPGPETAEVSVRLGFRTALLCPAVPDLGRLVRGGAVVGAGVPAPIPLDRLDIGARVAVHSPDIDCAADIDAALASLVPEGAEDRVLMVGARGLAEALARRMRPASPPRTVALLPAPMLLAIGSRDPITLAQVEHLQAKRDLPEITAPNGEIPDAGPRSERTLLLRIVPGAGEVPAPQAGAAFARGVAERLRTAPPATLVACGGETANGVLGLLGHGVLDVLGEVLPGVPVADLGPAGMRVVTKSGGFGRPDTLAILVDAAVDTS
jgi:D-threonate/D-erythronate kinase